MELLNRLTSPEQIKVVFDVLTPDERNTLGLRQDFDGRLIIDLSRLFHSGSVTLGKIWKMPLGDGSTRTWESVATEAEENHDLPQDFVLYLFDAAARHPWFQEKLMSYYGGIPEIEL